MFFFSNEALACRNVKLFDSLNLPWNRSGSVHPSSPNAKEIFKKAYPVDKRMSAIMTTKPLPIDQTPSRPQPAVAGRALQAGRPGVR